MPTWWVTKQKQDMKMGWDAVTEGGGLVEARQE